ncbi:hypothetical protein CPB83DRAFT_844071 [Crepidotus variabilis]|uniref:Uncharacterized protein n=1 Tax=Crepidotus variabilis TaxID=179855 RepID=A0A9P6ETG0_9AGAR|nr:hypothetical protein CPB83DRAFT_844071 [Crepidotus variabilis]
MTMSCHQSELEEKTLTLMSPVNASHLFALAVVLCSPICSTYSALPQYLLSSLSISMLIAILV